MTSLIAAYSAGAAAEQSLVLEQVEIPAVSQSANLADIITMYRYVLSGLSARVYKADRCPVTILDGVVTCHLQVLVFPSAADLAYRMTISNGIIGEGMEVQEPREFDLIVPMTDTVDLGYLASEVQILSSTNFYDPSGAVISPPEMVLSGTSLKLSQKCFAVLRVRCLALGFRHDVAISVTKEIGYKVENLASLVQATWMSGGELESTSISLDIPDCVNSLLEYCPDTGNLAGARSRVNPDDEEKIPVVRYSQCTGAFLGVRYE